MYLTTHTSLSSTRTGFAPERVHSTHSLKWYDKVYKLLAHGRWFSPNTSVSSTTNIGRYDIAEILLKVALNTINQIIFFFNFFFLFCSIMCNTFGLLALQDLPIVWLNIRDDGYSMKRHLHKISKLPFP